ncbi:dTDP-4-dehydrorhamnose 3,5-epimerase [Ruminococcaceae bacterium OttesenSCG-928-A16]|nr:dTDP-4-dehydrorhamnose 3,5-epimerase [Ruminococcaceae bacterium OttesenSCG-928-A16]
MGKFKFIQTEVPGIVIVEPTVFGDDRGYFMETYHQQEFAAAGITDAFVQDNQSMSRKGVLRGLHFQKSNTQGKLVRVISGRVFDVGVDLRPGSPFFGRWAAAELTSENKRQLYVPQGFAHGFLVLSDIAEFTYKCTDLYTPTAEGGVRWNDPDIDIRWPMDIVPQLSEKDEQLPFLKNQEFSFFERWGF